MIETTHYTKEGKFYRTFYNSERREWEWDKQIEISKEEYCRVNNIEESDLVSLKPSFFRNSNAA